jgi:predicted RNA-binding protein associated with RNAse of E/G family
MVKTLCGTIQSEKIVIIHTLFRKLGILFPSKKHDYLKQYNNV